MARVGIFGCGKTTAIVGNLTDEDGVALPGPEQVHDVKERLLKRKKKISPDRVRTMDSILLNGLTASGDAGVERLFIDEFYMTHAGKILALITLLKPKCVYSLGDPKQIHYINRRAHYHDYFSSPTQFTVIGKPMNVTFRSPRDVTVAVQNQYDFKIYSASMVKRSVFLHELSEINTVVQRADHVICHSHGDLAKVRGQTTLKEDQYSSTHRFQGNEREKMAVVRCDPSDIHLFKSAPHALVAATRHTTRLDYACVPKDDALKNIIKKANKATELELEEIFVSPKDVKPYTFPLFNVARPYTKTDCVRDTDIVRGTSKRTNYRLVAHAPTRVHPDQAIIDHLIVQTADTPNVGVRLVSDAVQTEPEVHEEAVPIIPSYPCGVEVLQSMYDHVNPGVSSLPFEYDQYEFDHSGYVAPVEATVTQPIKAGFKFPKYDRMRPLLRTAAPAERVSTQHGVECAISARNCAVPKLAAEVDDTKMAALMVETFERTYIADDKWELYMSYASDPISINGTDLGEWLYKKDQGRKARIIRSEPLTLDDLRAYEGSLKATPKPDRTHAAGTKFVMPQVIAAAPQYLNAIFGMYVRAAVDRLVAVLDGTGVVRS